MSFFPINAKVECSDGPCGESTTIVVNPVSRDVTYVVVKNTTEDPHVERLVPVAKVAETTHDLIRLDCASADLAAMDPFVETRYMEFSDTEYMATTAYYGFEMPYAMPTDYSGRLVEEECVPEGQYAVHRGTHVHASDGHIGQIGEFVISPESGHLSHFIMEAGHFWDKKEITVPMLAIDRVEDDTVYLKLDKHAVSELPAVKVKRHYRGKS
ncbi:MAG: hypothetical protein J5I90_21430 [Caldilineales bacterium]|nr:hypothetical protein [Caldilineales bacterium]